MSKPADRNSSRPLLARILETPHLAHVVPQLAPETLHRIILHSGLDACGELVEAATPEQLTSIFDLDLWRNDRPGRDEQFDASRFAEWIEMLSDAGASVAARTVAAMDPALVIAGLSRHLRVFDPATFGPSASSDDEPLDLGSSSEASECEVGGYLLRARGSDAWDAIVELLVALDDEQPECFHAVMQGCRGLSNSAPEVDGLDDLLTDPAQLTYELAGDREERRSQQGYSTPAQAQAFLQLARQRRDPREAVRVNPVAAAYFRSVAEPQHPAATESSEIRDALPPAMTAEVSDAVHALVDLLADEGLVPERPRALLEQGSAQAVQLNEIRALMEDLRERDEPAYLARSRELAFLANTLVAGCAFQSRAFTPQEASDAVVAVCNLGLEQLARDGMKTAFHDNDLVAVFDAGWVVLYEDVCLYASDELNRTLTALLPLLDGPAADAVYAARLALGKQRRAGTPWHMRDELDIIATLDLAGWTALLGLFNECPVIPAALTAIVEGTKGAISPSAFAFISTRRQIDVVHEFMRRLPAILGQ